MKGAAVLLTVLGLLLGSARATDVRLQVSDPALQTAVQQALSALSTAGSSYTLVNAPDTLFVLGGSAPFGPDVASRSFAGPPPRVEFNPQGPIPLADAVQAELRRLLKLPPLAASVPATGASTVGTSGAGTPAEGTATAAGSSAGTPVTGSSTDGASTAGASARGTASTGTSASGASTAGSPTPGTSTAATSTPPVKAGPADLNGDGTVDPADLAIFMANLGKTGKNLPGDLNGDGRVDDRDLQLFVKAYQLP